MRTKALIYCRVSSDKQAKEGHGIDGQDIRCRQYAQQMGYEVVRVFKDEGISGGVIDRPGMQELLQFLDEHGKGYVIIVDDIKRLARDLLAHFTLRKTIDSKGATLESTTHKLEDTPEGKYVESILAATAELERNQNARQVKNRMRARMQLCYYCFRSPPRGLKYIVDARQGKILIHDEPLASIYKEAIESYEKNILNTLEEVKRFILDKYKKHGINRKLSISGARHILSKLLYTGYFEYKPYDIPLQKFNHQGFISLETYNNVQSKLQGKTKIHIRKDYRPDFPLRTFVFCSDCDKPMTAAWCQGRKEKHPYYWCRNRECPSHYKMVRKSRLEGDFEAYLEGVKVSKESAALTQTILTRTWKEEKEFYILHEFNRKLKQQEIQKKITNLTERVSGLSDPDLIGLYEKQIKDLILEGKNLNPSQQQYYTEEQFQTASDMVFGILKEPVRMWQSPQYESKSTIVRMYFPEGLRYDIQRGFQTARLEPAIALINSLGRTQNDLVEMPRIERGSEKAL